MAESLLLVPNPKAYHWVSQGVTVVDYTDDGEEGQITDGSGWAGLVKDWGEPWGPAGTATRPRQGRGGEGGPQSCQEAARILPWRFLGVRLAFIPSLSQQAEFLLAALNKNAVGIYRSV